MNEDEDDGLVDVRDLKDVEAVAREFADKNLVTIGNCTPRNRRSQREARRSLYNLVTKAFIAGYYFEDWNDEPEDWENVP